MPGPYVTSAGLTIPTVESLKADVEADQRALIDPLIDVDAEEVLGETNGIFVSALREAFEVLEVAYNAFDPDAVEDSRVDVLLSITGSKRGQATKSRFDGTRKLEVDLDADTTLPEGTIFEVAGAPTIRFLTTEEIESTTPGAYLVSAEAETAGRAAVAANTLTVITTPIVGLNSVTNPFDAIEGSDVDTDSEALVRRENELDALGSSTPPAIRAHLLDYEQEGTKVILSATVLENDGDAVDAQGLPSHSIECIVFDGLGADADDDAVAQVIWDNRPAGTRTVGTSSGVAIKKDGGEETMFFSRPTQVGVDVDVTINTDATYAGDAAVQLAWKTYVDAIPSGADTEVKFSQAIRAILGVQGVIGIETIRLRRHGGSYLSAFTDLPLASREKSYADQSSSYCAVTIA